MLRLSFTALAIAGACGAALAQSPNVKPPQAQAWIDVATYSGMGMPGMGAGGNPMSALGGLFGGGSGGAKNTFGQTQTGSAGRWVDVTLMTRANPSLSEAQQAVPAGFLSPALKLQAPKEVRTPARATTTTRWSSTSTSARRASCCSTGVAAPRCAPANPRCSTWPPPRPPTWRSSSSRAVPRSAARTAPWGARCGRARWTRGWCLTTRRWSANTPSPAAACPTASASRSRLRRT